MAAEFEIRPARVEDVPALARVHVESWRETYRGLMPDAVLDDPGFVPRRERFWTAALGDPRFAEHAVALASLGGEVVGVAMSGPPRPEDGEWDRQLFVLYAAAAVHGSGIGAALLDAVLPGGGSAVLWVADPNPRAQAFYRKHGFEFDGAGKVEDGVRELRMVRASTGA
ncbi:GNAT family N-acetyltransferase [Gulosibacter sp. 10]|uniref:GNAT family N-acetyltransferase n=1 Tax=Gulosibacter sp. 10 TaxID=1255570 RepID=UPI00097F4925|nr:GNAT family N-acetyltransferase [Gulosibacter sp. 10]SJM56193.1 GCN5-related N-acetyltransferase [Gulosibacter sp. 10]